METTLDFRRRPAITYSRECRTGFSESIEKDVENHFLERQKQVSKLNGIAKNNVVKFNKINQTNHAILKNRKKQQQFHKIVQELQHRRCTFYRMGFKSHEKIGNKKMLSDVLNLSPNQMRGTIFVGQLWANHEVSKYLKQNKIYVNKLKLMDKLQTIKRQFENSNAQSQSLIDIGSIRSIATSHNISTTTKYNLDRDDQTQFSNKAQINKSLDQITGNLKRLKKATSRNCFINEIKYLQRCKDRLDKVEKNYFLKMIELE